MSLEEAGGSLGENAIFTLDVSQAEDPLQEEPTRGVEINQYFHSLLTTKQMAHELIEAIQHKKPARVVKHRAHQIARSIEHYGQHKDANVAVAVLSMLSVLPLAVVRTYDDDLAEIGRKLGMSAPLDGDLR